MDIDLLSDSPDEDLLSFSSDLLSDLPRQLIPDTSELSSQDTVEEALHAPQRERVSIVSNDKAVISKIATITESIIDCVLGGNPVLEIHTKSRRKQKKPSQTGAEIDSRESNLLNNTRFPSKHPTEAPRFAAVYRILELSNEALVSGISTTKRDIYYREPELFTTQATVDRYVDDIAYTLGLNRDSLKVVAAAKGLVVGDLSATKKAGDVIQYWSESELNGLLIPKVDDLEHVHIGEARWILVIEKEATFRTLASSEYWRSSLAGTGILITAKGYPDVQTRQFLFYLSTNFPHIPIFALVDFDPDGIGIMSTYKHGSKSLAHETNLNVPSIKWLGIRSSEMLASDTGTGLLSLTKRDRSIAKRMLGQQDISLEDQEWKRELRLMLMLNTKAEIQILGDGDQLGIWLDGKLSEGVEVETVDPDGDILML